MKDKTANVIHHTAVVYIKKSFFNFQVRLHDSRFTKHKREIGEVSWCKFVRYLLFNISEIHVKQHLLLLIIKVNLVCEQIYKFIQNHT